MLSRRMFLSLAGGAAGLAACGRQVTPDPGALGIGNDLAGHMRVRFRVRGPLDFTNLNYVIAFNTSGVGGEPYPHAYETNYLNFSYAFAVGARYGGNTVTLPSLFQYVVSPNAGLNPQPVAPSPSLTQLIPQDSASLDEFQLIFAREQLDNPLAYDTPSPSPVASASPVATPSLDPAATPTPSPTSVPSGFAPSSSPIPNARPTTAAQRYWFVNFFTFDRDGTPLDSLGVGGPNDASYTLAIDTATTRNYSIFRPSGILGPPSNLSAYIDGGEIDNYV